MRIEDLEGLPGILYLRKSRKDLEAEREAAQTGRPYDTLQKHREELFKMVRNYKLNVIDVLSELVSGEFIAEREEMQKVLDYLSEGTIRWVGVMDEDRLGRGDKIDQGRIERAFKESGAFIITPGKIVDLQDEADELYMDYKGMGARYEYKQTKKRLHGGRRRSAGRGNFVGGKPPYGYLKGIDLKTEYPHLIKEYVQKAAEMENLKLYPHPEESEVVKQIFEWMTSGAGIRTIAKRLTGAHLTPTGLINWNRTTITKILKNPVYTGIIRYGNKKWIKRENGTYMIKPVAEREKEIAKDAHHPLVSEEDFDKVQNILKANDTTPLNHNKVLTNIFAGLLKCGFCNLSMSFQPRYNVTRSPRFTCMNPHCKMNKSIILELFESRVLDRIEQYYQMLKSKPDMTKKNSDVSVLSTLEKRKSLLRNQLTELKGQINNIHDLLEKGVYTVEIFLERQKTLVDRQDATSREISEIDREIQREKEHIHNKEMVKPRFENVLNTYHMLETVEDKNKLLKSVIISMHYSKPKYLKSQDDFDLGIEWKT